jgi:alkylation response protein AidB-like acyl-CoA dehydrogenase
MQMPPAGVFCHAAAMDIESLSAMREAALDYFVRSRATQRRRALMEQPDAGEAQGWSALAALGWTGMLAPESAGGLGLELDGAAEILRAAGEHAAPEPLLAVAGLSALLLARLDTPAARALLSDLIAGRSLPALAWQESAGDLSAVPLACGCEARAGHAGGVLLQGEKLMVLPGAAASGWLVSARGDDDAVILWVPRGTGGVSETVVPLVDGGQASSLRFEQVALPSDAVLAEGPAAQDALRHALAAGQILQAAELLGAGQAMLAQTLAYLRTRSQFGKPIGSFQALQHRCVDMFIHLEVAQAALNEVLVLANTGLPVDRLEAEASRVNARCTAAALQASRTSVQLHGAIGYTQECDLSLFYKRVLCLSAWLGNVTAHQHRHGLLAGESEATTSTAPHGPASSPAPPTGPRCPRPSSAAWCAAFCSSAIRRRCAISRTARDGARCASGTSRCPRRAGSPRPGPRRTAAWACRPTSSSRGSRSWSNTAWRARPTRAS